MFMLTQKSLPVTEAEIKLIATEINQSLTRWPRILSEAEIKRLIATGIKGLPSRTDVESIAAELIKPLQEQMITLQEQMITLQEQMILLGSESKRQAGTNIAVWNAAGTGARAYADSAIYSAYSPAAVLKGNIEPFWYHNLAPEIDPELVIELPAATIFDRVEIEFHKDNFTKLVRVFDENSQLIAAAENYDGSGVLTLVNVLQMSTFHFRFNFSDKKNKYAVIESIKIFATISR
jgi:hypothetical protein